MIFPIAVLHDRLEADLTLLRKSFNQRILYFGHLQEISDSVADVERKEEDGKTCPVCRYVISKPILNFN